MFSVEFSNKTIKKQVKKQREKIYELTDEECAMFAFICTSFNLADDAEFIKSFVKQRSEDDEKNYKTPESVGCFTNGTGGGKRVIRSTKPMS